MRNSMILTGVALVAAFFMPWSPYGHVSGWSLATSGIDGWFQLAVAMVPLAGLALIGAGLTGLRPLRALAGGAIGYACLYTLFMGARVFFTITSWGLWIAIAAIIIAVVALIVAKK